MDDLITIIGRNFVDIESEGWISKGVELYFTGGWQETLTRAVSDVCGAESTTEVQYSPVKCEYINCILKKLQGLLQQKWALNNFKVKTHFHKTLRAVQVKGKRVPIHVLPKVEAAMKNLLKEGRSEKLGKKPMVALS